MRETRERRLHLAAARLEAARAGDRRDGAVVVLGEVRRPARSSAHGRTMPPGEMCSVFLPAVQPSITVPET